MYVEKCLEPFVQPFLDQGVVTMAPQEGHETCQKHVGIGFLVHALGDGQFVEVVLTREIIFDFGGELVVEKGRKQLFAKPRTAAFVAEDVRQRRHFL